MTINYIELYNHFDGFVLENIFTPEECTHYITMAEEHGFEEAPISTNEGQIMMKSVRNNERAIVFSDEIAAILFQRAEKYLPMIFGSSPTRLNECIRFYRYDIGQRFNRHIDGSYQTPNAQEKSRMSFIVYLNDNFEGGQTTFDNYTVTPKIGSALIFMHGERHKGEAVTAGRKYVMRSDVMYPRSW